MGFPKGFLWGGSISAAQIEGGWNEGGKSPVLVDYCTAGSTKERRQIWYLDKDGKRVHRNWEAVDELEELINDETAGIGDSYNDLEMFKVVDHSFTFKTSPKDIQQQTSFVVSSVKEAIEILKED